MGTNGKVIHVCPKIMETNGNRVPRYAKAVASKVFALRSFEELRGTFYKGLISGKMCFLATSQKIPEIGLFANI